MGLDFDIRYRKIIEILNLDVQNFSGKILEVGALPPACLSWYLDKKIKYTGINKNFEDLDYNIHKIDLFNTNFKDKEFKYSISTDTLEHVEKNKRLDFIKELIRVTSDTCIIGIPNPNVQQYEKTIVNLLNATEKGVPYVKFFKEHEEFGIPSDEEMKFYLDDLKYEVVKNFNLNYWVAVIMADVHKIPINSASIEDLNDEPTYRSFYIIKLTKRTKQS